MSPLALEGAVTPLQQHFPLQPPMQLQPLPLEGQLLSAGSRGLTNTAKYGPARLCVQKNPTDGASFQAWSVTLCPKILVQPQPSAAGTQELAGTVLPALKSSGLIPEPVLPSGLWCSKVSSPLPTQILEGGKAAGREGPGRAEIPVPLTPPEPGASSRAMKTEQPPQDGGEGPSAPEACGEPNPATSHCFQEGISGHFPPQRHVENQTRPSPDSHHSQEGIFVHFQTLKKHLSMPSPVSRGCRNCSRPIHGFWDPSIPSGSQRNGKKFWSPKGGAAQPTGAQAKEGQPRP